MAETGARRPRLADVASRAGVSKKTVSNVINEFPFVAEQTRTRVLEAIRELEYRPNLSARNLARGRTGIIALVIPQLDMPYFSELARHVVDVAQRRSWVVLIEQTMYDRAYEQRIVDGEVSRRIDGLLFSPSTTSAAALRRRTDSTPLVLLGEVIYDGNFDHVSIDNIAAARTATRHLVDLGRRRIAAIGAKGGRAPGAATQRLNGYQSALTEAGLPIEPQLIRQTQRFVGEAAVAAMDELLDLADPPDAVFCFTDLLALGALRAIHRRGLRVPDDIALVGHDDIPYGRISTPSLTTIAPHKLAIAETAVDLLEQRLAHRGRLEPREVHAAFELKIRESTAAA
jgi:LacI family transcriptional regulator, repressor for deo operon, udp, cdd, tsx, nupC, and nupG